MVHKNMYAGFFDKPNTVDVRSVLKPVPKPGEALIKVDYVGICGSDMLVYKGEHPRCKPGTIMCHEYIGEVTELSSGTNSAIKIGDKVAVEPIYSCNNCQACRSGNQHVCEVLKIDGIDHDGGLAEYKAVSVEKLHVFDQKIDLKQAALIEPIAVAVHVIRCSKLNIGSRVLVLGGGPIGHLVALVCRAAGAKVVAVSELNSFRREILQNNGLQTVDPIDNNLGDFIKEKTSGEGVDITFEVSGAEKALEEATSLTNICGQIVIVSLFKKPPAIDLMAVCLKEYEIIGRRTYSADDYRTAINLLENNVLPLEGLVTDIVTLEKAEEGFKLITESSDIMKVLIQT